MTINPPVTGRLTGGIAVVALLLLPLVADADAPPETTEETVERAQQAVEQADFDRLVPLLEQKVTDGTDDARAHLLYGLGLIYEARDEEDDTLAREADDHLAKALEIDPELDVDPLLYPPRFIARLDSIRDDTPASSDPGDALRDPTIFYFERRIKERSRLPLYLPGGIGQFYNETPFRGVTFAAIQSLGLAIHIGGYWFIESLRNDAGHLPADQVDRARDARRLQYVGLGMLLGGWIIGAVEAHLNFEPETVRFRMLDEPPEPLQPMPDTDLGLHQFPGLQWTISF